MNKIVVIPSSLEHLKEISNYDAVILGIDKLSVNLPFYICEDKIEETIKYLNDNNKEIFISLNKNMHNSDLDLLKTTLIELSKLNIKAVLYYDISIVNIKDELNLNIDLVWAQEHMTTNYYTMNYWYDKKVNYTYLSSEITLDEIKTIKENSKMQLLVNGFGYIPMFDSKRHLVKNYLNTFNIKDDSNINYLYKEEKTYPIIDDKNGTVVYTDKPLNIIKELINLNVDYIVLNSFNIDKELFNKILELVNEKKYDEINDLVETSKYFLFKETIYKVKKND